MSFMPGDNPQDDGNRPDDDEQGGQPAPRRYGGGKYASLEEFERGYSESFQEINRVRSEALAAQAEAAAYKRMLEQQGANRPAPDPGPSHIPVEDEGVPRAHVRSLAAEEAARVAREAVAEALRPIMAGVSARTEMLKRNPEYGKHEVDVQNFLAQDPYRMQMYQEMAQVNPIAAMEFAYSGWRATNPNVGSTIDQNARTHAGMPNAAPTNRADEKAELDQRMYNQLLKEANETDDYTKFLEYRLRGVVPPGHLKRPA